MNKIAWEIISSLCKGIGTITAILFLFGDWEVDEILKLGTFIISIIIALLLIGKYFFGG